MTNARGCGISLEGIISKVFLKLPCYKHNALSPTLIARAQTSKHVLLGLRLKVPPAARADTEPGLALDSQQPS